MPEQTLPPTDDVAAIGEVPPAAGGSSLTAKLGMLLFLGLVVGGECMLVYLFLPSREETAAMVGGPSENALANPAVDPAASEVEESTPQVEVDLGEFGVTAYQPVSNTTLRIDFHLYGTVATEDEKDFLASLERNAHRFRDQVIVTLRSSDITDLTDAGLGLIKRKILEKTNAMLGKRYLRGVIFSDFSFIEQ